MTTYSPILSVIPPVAGQVKRLFTPQLFDYSTGKYPSGVPTTPCGYQKDSSGRLQYYEGSQPSAAVNGAIQATITGPPTTDYWSGIFQILASPGREVLASNVNFKGSQIYNYRPTEASPWYFELSQVAYTDSTLNAGGYTYEGGNDQKWSIAPGTYILRFTSVSAYTKTVSGPPCLYSQVDTTSISTMEYTVTVQEGETTVQAFALV